VNQLRPEEKLNYTQTLKYSTVQQNYNQVNMDCQKLIYIAATITIVLENANAGKYTKHIL